MAVITIGTVKSIREPENFSTTPDDRQELAKVLGGVFIVDGGHYPNGDVLTFTAVFNPTDFTTLKSYWHNRTKVDVVDHNNVLIPSVRILIKKYEYVKKHNFWQVNLEIWRL